MRPPTRLAVLFILALCVTAGSVGAQNRYDDSKMDDRLYLTLGGFSQTDIKTTLRLDAKTPGGAVSAGTVVALESLFDLDDQVNTARLDGWWRFNKRHRITWDYFRSKREGTRTYNGDTIEIGDIVINPGDFIRTDETSQLLAVGWDYSFVNTSKYEAWIGVGLNIQKVDLAVNASVAGSSVTLDESAKGTVPIPTVNLGGRYNFSKKVRMLLFLQVFGLRIGDYSGKLNDTRLLAEWSATKHFGIGGGLERFNLGIEAENADFLGSIETGYTAFMLYFKGQL